MRGLETRALSDMGLIPAPRSLTHPVGLRRVGDQPSPDSRMKGLDSSDLMGSGKVTGGRACGVGNIVVTIFRNCSLQQFLTVNCNKDTNLWSPFCRRRNEAFPEASYPHPLLLPEPLVALRE